MSDSVSEKYPRCGGIIAESVAKGLCPRRLLALSLEPDTAFTGDSEVAVINRGTRTIPELRGETPGRDSR